MLKGLAVPPTADMRIPLTEVLATWPKPSSINSETWGLESDHCRDHHPTAGLLTLALRLYVRIGIPHKSGWDGWLMVAATVFGTGVTACVILASTKLGWDMHI